MESMESSRVQEYLKLLYSFDEQGKEARTAEIANRLRVSLPSVTEMLKKLADNGYIIYESYRSAILTDKGRKAAQKIARKHRLLECLLYNILRLGKNKVHKEACELEHALSDEVEAAICKVLNHPESCPDDRKPIPPCGKRVTSRTKSEISQGVIEKNGEKELEPLDHLCTGQRGIIAFIRGGKRAVQRLLDMGLTPGTLVKVVNSAPFRGPIEISVRESNVVIGRGLAAKVFLERK